MLCLDSPGLAYVRQSPITTFAIGPRRVNKLLEMIFPFLRYGYTPILKKWLRENAKNYDAIVLNGLWNYTSYGSWRTLRHLDVPYFVCPHGMLDPWLRKAKPLRHTLRMAFWNFFEWKVVRDARGIFYACEEERRLAQAFVSGCKREEFVMGFGARDIAGDADAQKAAFLARFPQLRGRKFIIFLSRIHPKKGLDLLIRAFSQQAQEFLDLDLVIVGPDQDGLSPGLKSAAAQLGIESRMHWLGMLTGDPKWGALRSSLFFVLPSHQENFGIAVVEAMALAVPVLITNKVNIWREVKNSKSGHVVSDDLVGVSQGLRYLCSLAPDQIGVIGQNARSCFERLFNLESNALEMIGEMKRLSHVRH